MQRPFKRERERYYESSILKGIRKNNLEEMRSLGLKGLPPPISSELVKSLRSRMYVFEREGLVSGSAS